MRHEADTTATESQLPQGSVDLGGANCPRCGETLYNAGVRYCCPTPGCFYTKMIGGL